MRSGLEIIGRDVDDVDNELNDALTPTPEFYIARYPVTVAQFRAFVEATGFEIGDAYAIRDPDSQPVRYVSWHEAWAYCDWLNDDVLTTLPLLEGSKIAPLVRAAQWRIALPSELEWEKAARGGLPDVFYPWGDTLDPNRANYCDSGIGDASAVGCFPANGFGIHDMIGNVWEWTDEPYFAYPYSAAYGRETHARNDVVLRGGAWSGCRRGDARCASRYWLAPDSRDFFNGFRVVLRSAPVR